MSKRMSGSRGRAGLGVLVGLALCCAGARSDDAAPALEAKAALEALKGMAGTWVVEEAPAEAAGNTIVYKVTAAGSAVVEEMFPGSDHEMLSVYHLDGDDLVMTHYCAAGNQPRLKLDRAGSTAKDLHFGFTGGTNLDPAKDSHMHEGRFQVQDDGRVRAEWTGYTAGKPAATHTFTMRKK